MNKNSLLRDSLKLLILAIIVLVAGVIFMFSGVYDVAATKHHSAPVAWALDQAMTASVDHHATSVKVVQPNTRADTLAGFVRFHNLCVPCHGAPGIGRSDAGQGLYPRGPDLAEAESTWTDAQLFWIIKNGVKDTGMPAFGLTHIDAQIWSIVAFLRYLPKVTPQDYKIMQDTLGSLMTE